MAVCHRPDGTRELLSTITGSMITVAGVAFSITIVALASIGVLIYYLHLYLGRLKE